MKEWVEAYLHAQKAALDSIHPDQIAALISSLRDAWKDGRQIFVFGNGGSAANASHFVTDLGKGASDRASKPFRCLSLNDNVSWVTALANDYAYDQVYLRQLQNYAQKGDWALMMSVSGSSPNLLRAAEWAKQQQLRVVAFVGGKRGALADLADELVVVDSEHYGRVEDVHMGICHMLCYAFIEHPSLVAS